MTSGETYADSEFVAPQSVVLIGERSLKLISDVLSAKTREIQGENQE